MRYTHTHTHTHPSRAALLSTKHIHICQPEEAGGGKGGVQGVEG